MTTNMPYIHLLSLIFQLIYVIDTSNDTEPSNNYFLDKRVFYMTNTSPHDNPASNYMDIIEILKTYNIFLILDTQKLHDTYIFNHEFTQLNNILNLFFVEKKNENRIISQTKQSIGLFGQLIPSESEYSYIKLTGVSDTITSESFPILKNNNIVPFSFKFHFHIQFYRMARHKIYNRIIIANNIHDSYVIVEADTDPLMKHHLYFKETSLTNGFFNIGTRTNICQESLIHIYEHEHVENYTPIESDGEDIYYNGELEEKLVKGVLFRVGEHFSKEHLPISRYRNTGSRVKEKSIGDKISDMSEEIHNKNITDIPGEANKKYIQDSECKLLGSKNIVKIETINNGDVIDVSGEPSKIQNNGVNEKKVDDVGINKDLSDSKKPIVLKLADVDSSQDAKGKHNSMNDKSIIHGKLQVVLVVVLCVFIVGICFVFGWYMMKGIGEETEKRTVIL